MRHQHLVGLRFLFQLLLRVLNSISGRTFTVREVLGLGENLFSSKPQGRCVGLVKHLVDFGERPEVVAEVALFAEHAILVAVEHSAVLSFKLVHLHLVVALE